MRFASQAAALRRLAPFIVPLVLLGVAYAAVIRPRTAAARESAARAYALRGRVAAMRRELQQPPPQRIAGRAVQDFALRTPDDSRVLEILETLARRGLAPGGPADVRNLLIETGDRVDLASASAEAPRVAGDEVDRSDPRFALFSHDGLAYTPITIGFESTYGRVGDFLWGLRMLPTIVEINALELAPSAAGEGRVRATVKLLAYQRTSAPASAHPQWAPSRLAEFTVAQDRLQSAVR